MTVLNVARGARPMGPGFLVAMATAVAYALVGALALALAGPPGYASPLYPSAGIALVAVLCFGRAALPGVLLGSLAVNMGLGLLQAQSGAALLVVPLVIGLGALLQAWAGAALIRRYAPGPLLLNSPREIAAFGLFGALMACVVSPSMAIAVLLVSGAITPVQLLPTWLTWWAGNTLGVLIVAPIALALVARPAAEWRPRQRTVALPLLLVLALMAATTHQLNRSDAERHQTAFERQADRLTQEVQDRLQAPLFALQALHSAALVRGELNQSELAAAAAWWLQPQLNLQAAGYSVRVARADLPAFEAAVRAQDLPDYKVFDRPGVPELQADAEVVVMRLVAPLEGNAAALGVNTLSIPAARAALLATRRSGVPAASAGFRLTQSAQDETGVVLYQALFDGRPADDAARQASFRGLVFVSLRAERALDTLPSAGSGALRWCLVDPDPAAARPRIAGPVGCENDPPSVTALHTRRTLSLADRPLQLRLVEAAAGTADPGAGRRALISGASLSAAALLGALLLTITGHSRRTERAVQDATARLRQEIKERSNIQQALSESEARLRSLFEQVPIGVMFMAPDGTLLQTNPRLSSMLGIPEDALRGRSILDLTVPGEAGLLLQGRAGLLRDPDTGFDRQLQLRHADGHTFWVRVQLRALRNADGRVHRLAGVVEDITETRRLAEAERARDRAEVASRAKSEFVSRMSHELRTPLNAMLGFAQLMSMPGGPQLDPIQHDWAQQIQRAGWHLLEMINETLDLARIESGADSLALAPVVLAPLVAASQGMVATLAAQRGITVAVDLPADLPAVRADATRLTQVLTNLLSNAVKYNRDGGTVRVAAREVAGRQVEITVSDTGLGLSATQLQALFEPYNRLGRETSSIEGTGIGLVISRRLAELMGGTLRADSPQGAGAVFTLTLPMADTAATPPTVAADTAAAPYRRRLVHYIEDHPINVEVMRGVLAQRPQIELGVSTLGLDGLGAVRACQPDLILLDMQLPDISGLELLRHFKRDDAIAHIPVVVVSADATLARTEEALTLGAARYVTKPFEVAEFLELIDTLLAQTATRFGEQTLPDGPVTRPRS